MKAVIIEDEEIIAKVLENKINKVAPDVQVIHVLPSLKNCTQMAWRKCGTRFIFYGYTT